MANGICREAMPYFPFEQVKYFFNLFLIIGYVVLIIVYIELMVQWKRNNGENTET